MNKYLIYTEQGYTESPNGSPVENYQLLGRIKAKNKQEAEETFLKNNPWVTEEGFTELSFVQLHESEWT